MRRNTREMKQMFFCIIVALFSALATRDFPVFCRGYACVQLNQ